MIRAFFAKILVGLLALLGVSQPPPLGYSVATGYKSTLSASITSGQSFIPVSSLTLKDDTVLTINALGGKVFLDIEPGGNKEEIVMCTGINTSTNQFNGCTRGLAFSGTSTAAVSANQKSHNSGSTIVISNVHYVYEQYADVNDKPQTLQGDRTVTGTWTFTGTNTSTAGLRLDAWDRRLTAYNNSTNPFIRFNTSTGHWQFSNNGTDTTNLATSSAAGLSASSTAGIGITNSEIHINPSSSLGMAFGVDGYLYQKTSSTLAIESDIDGIKINTTTLVNLIATSTPKANKIPITNASGTLPISWIATSTTNTSQFLRSSSTGAYWSNLGNSHANTSTITRQMVTEYQNTSRYPLLVTISINVQDGNGTGLAEVFVSSTQFIGVRVARVFAQDGDVILDIPITFLVPPLWYYKVIPTITGTGVATTGLWYEMEL